MSGSRGRRACTKHVSYSEPAAKFEEEVESDEDSKALSDQEMETSSEEEGGEDQKSDDFKKFACSNPSTGAKNGLKKGRSSSKPSLRTQLSEALSGKKRKAKRSKDYDNEESSGEEDSEKEEDVKVPAKRRNKQSASKPPKGKRARKVSGKESEEAEGSSDGDDDAEESGEDEAPSKRGAASGKASRSKALEEMKRRRAKGRASDDNRRALELALSGGGDTGTATSSGKDTKGAKSDAGDGSEDEEASSDEDEESGSEEEDSESSEEEAEDNTSGKDKRQARRELRKKVEQAQQILNSRRVDGKTEYLCKFRDVSYRKLEWLEGKMLKDERRGLVAAYHSKLDKGKAPTQVNEYENGVCPEWVRVERVVAAKGGEGTRDSVTKYLVKWEVLGYQDCTWEPASELANDEDAPFVDNFWKREKASEKKASPASPQMLTELLGSGKGVPDFLNGRKLRDYQIESFNWMVQHALTNSSCILGDEMGLGKTAQSIAVLEFLRVKARVRDPMLIVAPLTTLGHWRREIETWTNMNVICYMGGRDDRVVIDKHELWKPRQAGQRSKKPKFDILLTSFEILRDCGRLFESISWSALVVDEAHRLKNTKSAVRQSIRALEARFLLLLTGTPIQNNMSELFSIMNLVDPEKFPKLEDFLTRFGDPVPTPEQLQDLQECLRPILLRRMKEDVETLPEKEEVIIWVELTTLQREYYKSLYEKDIASLLTGVKASALPGMRNLAMELRKLCCHPFLCNGIEDDMVMRLKAVNGREPSRPEALEAASGKLLLVRKLLTKLRSEKRRVLIFSQFKIMLDLLEEMIEEHLRMPYERLDGDTKGQERQAAMDRFQNGGDDVAFAFLLSTKAGGQGITLTAADTIVLYDSDWNPQNDLQAMARAHRIGQTNEVTIYRLVTKNTYEESLINVANKKGGLNEAILGNLASGNSDDPHENAAMISRLLKEGAHSLLGGNEEEAKESAKKFESEDIGDILAQRTSKRIMRGGGKAGGGTFSVANFKADDGSNGAAAGEGADFWRALLPDAVKAAELAEKNRGIVSGPRRRRAVNYNEDKIHKDAEEKAKAESNSGSSEYSQSGEEEEDDDDDQEYATEAPLKNPTNSTNALLPAQRAMKQPGSMPAHSMDPTNVPLNAAMQANHAAPGPHGPGRQAAHNEAIRQVLLKAQADSLANLQRNGPRDIVPAHTDHVQDVTDALLNRFGPAHIDMVLCALSNETLTQSAILPNHSDYLASRLRTLMKEGNLPAPSLRKFFKTWIDVVRNCTSQHPSLYPSAVEAELRAMGRPVPQIAAPKQFPVERLLTPDEQVAKRGAEGTVRRLRKRKQMVEAGTVGGVTPAPFSETEVRQLADAERLGENLRLKELELKKKHLDDINSFLLAVTKVPWPNKYTAMARSPWKSVGTVMKKTLAEAAKNAAGRLEHWHSLDTLHNVLTQNPDVPIHNASSHAHTLQWHSPVSPQLVSTSTFPALPAAIAAVAHQQQQQQQQKGDVKASALDISTALMKKAEMLTRVNRLSSEVALKAHKHMDSPKSKFVAIKFFLAALQKALDARKDEQWLQARLLVALLAVGGEPAWGRTTSKANVESVGYVYQLLTIKVVERASFSTTDGVLKPDADFIKAYGAGTEKWAMQVRDAVPGTPQMPAAKLVWLSVELAQWLQRDLSTCAFEILTFLSREVDRVHAKQIAEHAAAGKQLPQQMPPPVARVQAATGATQAQAPAQVQRQPLATTATPAATAASRTAAAAPLTTAKAGVAAAAPQTAAAAAAPVVKAEAGTEAAPAKPAAVPAVKRVGDQQAAPIEVSSSSADAANADAEKEGEEEDEDERAQVGAKTAGTGKGGDKEKDGDDDDGGNSRDGTGGQKRPRDSNDGGSSHPKASNGKGAGTQPGGSSTGAGGGGGAAGPAATNGASESRSPKKRSLDKCPEGPVHDSTCAVEGQAGVGAHDSEAEKDTQKHHSVSLSQDHKSSTAKHATTAACTQKAAPAVHNENSSFAGNSGNGETPSAADAASPASSGSKRKSPNLGAVGCKSSDRTVIEQVPKPPTLSSFLKPVTQ